MSSCLFAVLMQRAVTSSRLSIVLRHRSLLDREIVQPASPAVMPHTQDADQDGMYLGRPSVVVAKRLEGLEVGLESRHAGRTRRGPHRAAAAVGRQSVPGRHL